MSDSIIVSLNGDSIAITTESTTGGFLLSKLEFLSLMETFIGNRAVFFRRQPKPQIWLSEPFTELKVDWLKEMAKAFGASLFGVFQQDASDCPDCGRLVKEPGLCAKCADEKAGFSQ